MRTTLLLGICTALSACANAPDLPTRDTLAPAARTDAETPPTTFPDVLVGYTSRPVKGPDDWRTLNRRQSPAEGEGS
ncbi:hypothetical protein [uncultured Roseovarius sp.]|uniref:hypothetical protein n=1 Tax=uncultured Roseovarius sp. TaxID=293344 RepID=UPI002611D6FB|nr:hypothetical protein [uncultured Roseovarius sp.]